MIIRDQFEANGPTYVMAENIQCVQLRGEVVKKEIGVPGELLLPEEFP